MGMLRGYVLVYALTLVFGCGGGEKKTTKPKVQEEVKNEDPGEDTEADREKKRRMLAQQIIPEGTNCLPAVLKGENAPRLELAAIGKDAVVCAIDDDRTRLLGPIACWKVNLASGDLVYSDPIMLPGRGISVLLRDRCARDYCLPKDAKVGDDKVAHIAKNSDGSKVAVLAGDEVHLFAAESKQHEKSFSIRGDKGVTSEPKAVHFVDGGVLIEAQDEGAAANVWVFKVDGAPVGPIMSLGGKEKPLSTFRGSFSILDKARVGVSEHAMETLTIYEIESGKRTKLVRKVGKLSCKAAELDAYWNNGNKVSDKCKDSVHKTSGHLMGATVVAGAKSLLVMLRAERLGELAVMDAKSLAEKSSIKLPWCEGKKADKEAKPADKDAKADKGAEKESKKKAPAKGAAKDSADPQEGGE